MAFLLFSVIVSGYIPEKWRELFVSPLLPDFTPL
jgi:hypothetical protein